MLKLTPKQLVDLAVIAVDICKFNETLDETGSKRPVVTVLDLKIDLPDGFFSAPIRAHIAELHEKMAASGIELIPDKLPPNFKLSVREGGDVPMSEYGCLLPRNDDTRILTSDEARTRATK